MSTLDKTAREGVIAGLAAYLMWGVLPVYFMTVAAVAPTEVLAHRIIWAVPFGGLILTLRHQWPEVWRALTHRRMLGWLSISTLFIGMNWFVYIWAIQDGRIFETSLGYYINPLTNMLVGVWLFGERLRRFQMVAVALAVIGVLVLTISGGVVPWVALFLAVSFTVYAAIRKRVVIGGMPGLFVETILLLPFALIWFGYLYSDGRADNSITVALLCAGCATFDPDNHRLHAIPRTNPAIRYRHLLRRNPDNCPPDLLQLHLGRSRLLHLRRGEGIKKATVGAALRPRSAAAAERLLEILNLAETVAEVAA